MPFAKNANTIELLNLPSQLEIIILKIQIS